MIPMQSVPSTLLDLIESIPSEKTAIILPEQDIRVTYGALRTQVLAMAEQLAAAGVKSGDRVALVGFGVGYSWGATLIEMV